MGLVIDESLIDLCERRLTRDQFLFLGNTQCLGLVPKVSGFVKIVKRRRPCCPLAVDLFAPPHSKRTRRAKGSVGGLSYDFVNSWLPGNGYFFFFQISTFISGAKIRNQTEVSTTSALFSSLEIPLSNFAFNCFGRKPRKLGHVHNAQATKFPFKERVRSGCMYHWPGRSKAFCVLADELLDF